jgi:hypothetical protein
MDEIFYCGFNGFRQVPSQQDKQTITTLISQSGKSFASSSTEKSNKVILPINIFKFSLLAPLLNPMNKPGKFLICEIFYF